jgi:hypothetical protein
MATERSFRVSALGGEFFQSHSLPIGFLQFGVNLGNDG